MFTQNLPFEDALSCFQSLAEKKDQNSQAFISLEKEFLMYARRKAGYGDSAARAWLTAKGVSVEDESFHQQPHYYPHHKPEIFINPLAGGDRRARTSDMDDDLTDEERELYAEICEERDYQLTSFTKKDIDKLLKPLDMLTGLSEAKVEIRNLIHMEKVQQQREKAGLRRLSSEARHMLFTGNPGTGKTTVARLIGDIFYDAGLIFKPRVTEVDRSDLVGEYIGETAQKTQRALRKARGGILFVDEAHTLGYSTSEKDFGYEAVSILLKAMEDMRDDTIIIFAGYEEEMGYLMRMNPGFDSRINIRIDFKNMELDTLVSIFEDMARAHDYSLNDETRAEIKRNLTKQMKSGLDNFSNARAVRNLFEKTIRNQAQRVIGKNLRAKKSLRLLLPEDIPGAGPRQDGNVVTLPDKH